MDEVFSILLKIYEFLSIELFAALFLAGFLIIAFRWVRKVNRFIFFHSMTEEDAIVWAENMSDEKREAILNKWDNEEVTFKFDSKGRPRKVIRRQKKQLDNH